MPAAGELAVGSELRTHWRVVVASALGVGYGLSAMGLTYTLGAFVTPLSQEFAWSRQAVLSVTVFTTLAVVPASLVGGWIVDRYGARHLTLWSQLGLGTAFILMGWRIHDLPSLYGLYFLMPLLAIGTSPITFAAVIASKFARQRGIALGLALAGTGLCALTVPPYLAWVIGRWGWRAGYVAIGLLPILIALPTAWAWLHDPVTTSAGVRSAPATRLTGVAAASAYRSFRFWVMMLAFFAVSGAATGLLTNVVPLLTTRGLSPSTAAGALSLFGVAVIAGRMLFGWLVDRYWAPGVGFVFLAPASLAILMLISTALPWAWALLCLFVVGVATGAEYDLCAYLTARYFGLVAYGRIYGALFITFAAGAGASGPLLGALFDRYRSYDEILLVIAGGYLSCGALLLTLGGYPKFAGPLRSLGNS